MRKILSGVIISLLVVFGTTACLSFTNKKSIDASTFKEKMEDKGFKVVDTMDQLPENAEIKQSYIAISPKSEYKIEYYEFTSEENASSFYQRNKKIFELGKENNYEKDEVNIKNYSKYNMRTGSKYKVISRIGSTAIYVDENKKYEEVIDETLKDLGY